MLLLSVLGEAVCVEVGPDDEELALAWLAMRRNWFEAMARRVARGPPAAAAACLDSMVDLSKDFADIFCRCR